MTEPDDSRDLGPLLARIGWTPAVLAYRLEGLSVDTVGQWVRKRRVTPPSVIDWLLVIAAGVEAAGPLPKGWQRDSGLR